MSGEPSLMKNLDRSTILVKHLRTFFPSRVSDTTTYTPKWYVEGRENGQPRDLYEKFNRIAKLLIDLDENQKVPERIFDMILEIEQAGNPMIFMQYNNHIRFWVESALQDDMNLKSRRTQVIELVNSDPGILHIQISKKLLGLVKKNFYHTATARELDLLIQNLRELIRARGGGAAGAGGGAVPVTESGAEKQRERGSPAAAATGPETELCGDVMFQCYIGHRGRRYIMIRGKQVYFD